VISVREAQRTSLADQALTILRDEILSHRFPPGSRLTVRPLCEATGLSPTPIKAALTALTREGLVTLEPYRGYFVSSIDASDLVEIYELRQVLDGIAARRAAGGMDRDRLVAELRDLLAQQRACATDPDHGRYADLDIAFHRAIVEYSRSSRLITISHDLLAQLRLGRALSTSVSGQIERSLTEHAAIVDALDRGDGVAAEDLARRHVERASNALRAFLSLPVGAGSADLWSANESSGESPPLCEQSVRAHRSG